jgi:hypothetical protein
MRAAGGAKMTCFTCDHDKEPDEDVQLQRAREKNGQMKITYLVEGVVLHAAGDTKFHYARRRRRENGVLRDQLLPQAPRKITRCSWAQLP